MQARGVALDKSHDIAGAQARERDRSVAEPIVEETADERHVINDRRTSQRTLVAQVALERLYPLLNRSQAAWCVLLSGDHALPAQKVYELLQRGGVAPAHLHAASAGSQIPCRMLRADTAQSDSLLSEPSTKTCREQDLPVPRIPCVSLLAGPLRKRSNLRRQWTLQRPRQDHFIIDDALHGRLLPPFNRG
jgi:hypothetical protein